MASTSVLSSTPGFREEFRDRGGSPAARCYQCATCSSVCDLAPDNAPFPRRQMLLAQWGLGEQLVGDPGPWLCHQCNDCNVRCPRDAQPGDVMQSIRSMVVQQLAFPAFLGKLVGHAKTTWPLLIGLPLVLWIILLALWGGHDGHLIPGINPELSAVEGPFHYEHFVPHILIYTVYTLTSIWVALAALVSGMSFWKRLGAKAPQRGSFFGHLVPAVVEIATHKRFGRCGQDNNKRRWGHFLVLWGFVGAAVTSGFLVMYLYQGYPPFSWLPLNPEITYPVPITHWVKHLGNLSAIALVVGGVLLWLNRRSSERAVGATTAFDRFFLWIVLAVIATGVLCEVLRFTAPPIAGCTVYVIHLSVVLTLFFTFPYSKFAHIYYRTIAMVHQLAVEEKK